MRQICDFKVNKGLNFFPDIPIHTILGFNKNIFYYEIDSSYEELADISILVCETGFVFPDEMRKDYMYFGSENGLHYYVRIDEEE